MFELKAKKIIKEIESFTREAQKSMNYESADESTLEVYNFFGNYKLAISKTPISRIYSLHFDGVEKTVVEKGLMNEMIVKKDELGLKKIKDCLSQDYLAANKKTNERLEKLPVRHELF